MLRSVATKTQNQKLKCKIKRRDSQIGQLKKDKQLLKEQVKRLEGQVHRLSEGMAEGLQSDREKKEQLHIPSQDVQQSDKRLGNGSFGG